MKKNFYPLVLLAVLVLLPLAVKSNYFLHLMILFLLWVVIGSSWNILAGFTGQVSFGHAAFFGVGAYTAGLLFTHLQVSPWWGMALGGVVALLIGLPFGAICFPCGAPTSLWRPWPWGKGSGTWRRSPSGLPAGWWGS